MGRYMKKSKAEFEVTRAQSFSGVRTRAKTLALQRSRRSPEESCRGGDSGSYLQLRSRRLQKPPIGLDSRRHKSAQKDSIPSPGPGPNPNPSPNSKRNQSSKASSRLKQDCSANSGSVNKEEIECFDGVKKEENNSPEKCGAVEENDNNTPGGAADEASFGENLSGFEGIERTTRESTPCNLIRDSDSVQCPGSSTRRIGAAETNSGMDFERHIPTRNEINEFFAPAEEEQQRKFIEKYNFDPVNEKPLPGRFEWEKVNP